VGPAELQELTRGRHSVPLGRRTYLSSKWALNPIVFEVRG
jgi:hypothetical protein